MVEPVKTYRPGTTVEFTWTGSAQPDVAPRFRVFDAASNVAADFSAVSSSSTEYFALFTTPTSWVEQRFVAEFLAQKTIAGSLRDFIVRQPFRVVQTITTG